MQGAPISFFWLKIWREYGCNDKDTKPKSRPLPCALKSAEDTVFDPQRRPGFFSRMVILVPVSPATWLSALPSSPHLWEQAQHFQVFFALTHAPARFGFPHNSINAASWWKTMAPNWCRHLISERSPCVPDHTQRGTGIANAPSHQPRVLNRADSFSPSLHMVHSYGSIEATYCLHRAVDPYPHFSSPAPVPNMGCPEALADSKTREAAHSVSPPDWGIA